MFLNVAMVIANLVLVLALKYENSILIGVSILHLLATVIMQIFALHSVFFEENKNWYIAEMSAMPYAAFRFLNVWACGVICIFLGWWLVGALVILGCVVFCFPLVKHLRRM